MNLHYQCCICKKPLTNFTSKVIGMGPVCRAREKLQGELMFDNHAVFSIVDEKENYIFIKDACNHHNSKTVTNDVEWVLSELFSDCENAENKRIFYMDSEVSIDEIVHNGKVFISFKAGHAGVTL
jgi:hypothetical protein